jgi:hypothetical protein
MQCLYSSISNVNYLEHLTVEEEKKMYSNQLLMCYLFRVSLIFSMKREKFEVKSNMLKSKENGLHMCQKRL